MADHTAERHDPSLHLSRESRIIAGLLLLLIVTIEFGGWYMTRIAQGAAEMSEFQRSFARAGHGHAGVLVLLALIGQLYVDAAGASGPLGWIARLGIPAGALLMPAGFFLSSLGNGATEPNQLILLVWLGALALASGVIALGVGLIRRPSRVRAA